MSKDSKVRAIGGIFFKCENPDETRNWYSENLGLSTDDYGTNFAWRDADSSKPGYTQWSPFKKKSDYFGDEHQQFMINYRVDDLEKLVAKLRASDVVIVDDIAVEDYGKFVHIIDNDGRRVELWEPLDEEYEKMLDGVTR